MAQRKVTRKKAPRTAHKKGKNSTRRRIKTKTKRKRASPAAPQAKKRRSSKKATTAARSKRKTRKAPVAKPVAKKARKKAAKKAAKKVAARGSASRSKAADKRVPAARTARRTKVAKRKPKAASKPVKKTRAAAKPAGKTGKTKAGAKPVKRTKKSKAVAKPVKKTRRTKTSKKVAGAAEVVGPTARVPPAEPQEPGLPLKEVRARLGLIGPQIGELTWLEGLYLYGAELMERPRLEHVDFIVVYRGLRSPTTLKAAENDLSELIAAVLPVDFDLKLTGTMEIGRLLNEGNPAAQALLGYAEAVYTK